MDDLTILEEASRLLSWNFDSSGIMLSHEILKKMREGEPLKFTFQQVNFILTYDEVTAFNKNHITVYDGYHIFPLFYCRENLV